MKHVAFHQLHPRIRHWVTLSFQERIEIGFARELIEVALQEIANSNAEASLDQITEHVATAIHCMDPELLGLVQIGDHSYPFGPGVTTPLRALDFAFY